MKPIAVLLIWLAAALAVAQDVSGFRYIAHLPREDGGFNAVLLLSNSAPSEKTVYLTGYTLTGERIQPIVRLDLAPGAIEERPVAQLLPNASHLTIAGSKRVLVSVRYDPSDGPTKLSPYLHESGQVANHHHIYPGTPQGDAYWEGAAILNLTPKSSLATVEPNPVFIALKNLNDEPLASHILELNAFAKQLVLFGDLFPQAKELAPKSFYYEITSQAPLAVVSLMGNLESGDFAAAPPTAPPAVDEVTRGVPGPDFADDYSLISAVLESDVLTLRVSEDLSCRFQPTLYWDGNIKESFPVQADIVFGFAGSLPVCLGVAAESEFEFDISSVVDGYLADPAARLPMIINLIDTEFNTLETFLIEVEPGKAR